MSRPRPITGWWIPQDWDGQAWKGICLDWPDSDEYRQLLRDILYMLTRGRAYAEDKGTITEAQSVGWQIFDRNRPFVDCGASECPDDDTDDRIRRLLEQLSAAMSGCEECEDDMGCAVDKIAWIRTEGGLKLAYRICGRWALVGDMDPLEMEMWCNDGLDVDDIIPDVPGDYPDDVPPDEVPEDDIACRKAYVVVERMWEICEWWFENIDLSPIVFHYSLQSAFPDITWRWAGVEPGHLVWISLYSQAGTFDEEFTERDKQRLMCTWFGTMNPDSYGIDQSEWSRLGATLFLAVGADEATAINAVLAASGIGDWDRIAKTASALDITEESCNCPDESDDPTDAWAADWSYYFDMRETDPASDARLSLLSSAVWTSGYGVQSDPDDGNGYHTPGLEFAMQSPAASSVITNVWFKYLAPVDMDYSDGPKSYTDDDTLIPSSQKPDGDPSQGGYWVSARANLNINVENSLYVRWEAKGYNPSGLRELADSWTLVGVAVGGTGVDPFSGAE